jgi:ribosomal protein S1
LAPIHYPRVEDGDQEIIFEKLLELIGKELKVRIINIDEEEKRIVLSEREALKEEREAILADLEVGKIYEGVVSGLSSYGLFVTIGGTVEGLVHISEITYGHVSNIEKLGKIGEKMKVKVIGLENGKISLSSKKLKEDPWTALPREYKVGDFIEGEIIRFVPYGVFVRVFDDINGLVHLSELSQKSIQNPNEVVKLGQMVKTKIILLDPKNRKIGLSMKGLLEGDDMPEQKKPVANKPVVRDAKPAGEYEGKGLGDIAHLSAEEMAEKAKKISEKLEHNTEKTDGVVAKKQAEPKKKVEVKEEVKEEKEEVKEEAKKSAKKTEKKEEEKEVKKTVKKVAKK